MASSKSVINVSIIGDAKKLIGAVNQADVATGGLVKSAAKIAVTGVAIRKGFDLIGDSLGEADRRGDAIQRLEAKLGDLTPELVRASDGFSKIGASSQDILELEASFADLATSAGLAKPAIAGSATELSVAALAMAQIHDADPSAILDAIGKAVGGQTRGIKEYGVNLTEAAVAQEAMKETGKTNAKSLTDQELAAARVTLILQAFKPSIDAATSGTVDLAQRQDELGAKFETTMGKIGAGVEGPLTDVLTFINDEIDAIPYAVAGWQNLGAAIDSFGRQALAPLARVNDALEDILFNLSHINIPRTGNDPIADFIFGKDRSVEQAISRQREKNGLGR